MSDIIEKASDQTVDMNGKVSFNKGTKTQLMTGTFMAFIWGFKPLIGIVQGWNPAIGFPIAFIGYLIWFCNDRSLLIKNNAFVPHWLWVFLLPVYLYKRQARNGNSRWWVVFYIISAFIGQVTMIASAAAFNPGYYS